MYFIELCDSVQSVRRPLPHLVAYGSTNKYRPVNRSKASGNTAKRPTLEVYFPCTTATMLTMTATVKAMDSQRWVCRTHLFQFNDIVAILLDSRLLSRLRRQVGRFNTELLGILRVQPLPAAELHGLGADDAADGSSAEKASQNIETNVPTRRDSGQAGKLRGHSALPGAEGYTRNQRAIAEPGVRSF